VVQAANAIEEKVKQPTNKIILLNMIVSSYKIEKFFAIIP